MDIKKKIKIDGWLNGYKKCLKKIDEWLDRQKKI